MTAPNTPTRRFGAQLEELAERVDRLENDGRSGQLGNSSTDGLVRITDGTRVVATWGQQPDGTAHTRNYDDRAPARPNTPVVTPTIAGLAVEWNGTLVEPMLGTFSHVLVHASPVAEFIAGESNLVGNLLRAGRLPVAPLEYTPYYVKLVAVSTSGRRSEPSFEVSASPLKVVADEVLAGIVSELALAERAVTAAKLDAAAVTSTKIADNAITTPKLVAGAVSTEKIATGAVQAETIGARAVTAEKIGALAVTAEKIDVNAVTAGKIKAGAITSDKLDAVLVLASRLIAGDPMSTRVELSSSGMIVVRSDGQTTFSVDSATGNVVSMGEYYTSRNGERIAMNAGGLSSPSIRAYPSRGNYYASLFAETSATPSGNPVAFWGMRVPYVNSDLVGFVEFVAENGNTRAPIPSSKLWYRPYVTAAGVVIPGLQSFHQDVALTFSDGQLYVRNGANTAFADLNLRRLYADNVSITGNSIWSYARDGAVRWGNDGAFEVVNRSGSEFRGIRSSNFQVNTPSWRHMKIVTGSLADYLGARPTEVIRGLDLAAYRYDPATTVGVDHDLVDAGPMLDEVPGALIDHAVDEQSGMDRSSWSTRRMLVAALGMLQEQDAEVVDLHAQVAALTARLDHLTRRGAA